MKAESGPPRSWLARVAFAGGLYFLCVFAVGMTLGPVRVLWLEPWIGKTLAVLCEAPFLLAAMNWAALRIPRWTEMPQTFVARLAMGLVALGLQLGADLGVGLGLRDMTLSAQMHYFATPPGFIYIALLAALALMPLRAGLGAKSA